MSHPALRYTLYRLGIFAASFAVALFVLGLFDVNGKGGVVLGIGVAAAVSAIISYKLLNAQRDAMSEALYARVERAKARIDKDGEAEDESLTDGSAAPGGAAS